MHDDVHTKDVRQNISGSENENNNTSGRSATTNMTTTVAATATTNGFRSKNCHPPTTTTTQPIAAPDAAAAAAGEATNQSDRASSSRQNYVLATEDTNTGNHPIETKKTLAAATADDLGQTGVEEAFAYLESNKTDGNNLTDLQWNKTLDDAAMLRLWHFLRDNSKTVHLTRLALSHNANLTTVASADWLAKSILAQSCTLVSLDLSNNVNLLSSKKQKGRGLSGLVVDALGVDTCRVQYLNLSNNNIGITKHGGGISSIGHLLKYNRSIEHLSLAHNSIGPSSVQSLVHGLLESAEPCGGALRRLDLSYNKLSDTGVKRLAVVLGSSSHLSSSSCCSRLEHLDLTFNNIGPVGALYLAEPLATQNKVLQTLNLSLNRIGVEGAAAIRWFLLYNHTLVHLNLSRNAMGDDGVKIVAEGLISSEGGSRIAHLDLSWNSVTNAGAKDCADMLRHNAVLESLNMASNNVGDEGMHAIMDALYSDVALKELNIVGNQMRDATALVDYICHPSYKLTRLEYAKNKLSPEQEERIVLAFRFRDNKRRWLDKLVKDIRRKKLLSILLKKPKDFGDNELIYLASHLAKHQPTVTTAFFSSSRVSDRGVVALARNVLCNKNAASVQRLYCKGFVQVSVTGIRAIADSISQNGCLLVCLTLASCNIQNKGASILADALEKNTTITRLDLEGNRISDVGAKAIFAAVLDPPHPRLLSLNLAYNQLSDDALVLLGRLIRIEDLQLEGNEISDRGALDLAKAGMGSTSLRWLNLASNRLSFKGIQMLNLYLRNEFILDSRDQQSQPGTP